MKRVVFIFLALCFLLSMASCQPAPAAEHPGEQPAAVEYAEEDTEKLPHNYVAEFTEEILHNNRMNACFYGNMAEDTRYIYYRHPKDYRKIYRYNKATGKMKVLFENDDSRPLFSIQIFENALYFITGDESASALYKMDFDGGNLEKVLDRVAEKYVLTPEYIYYPAHSGDGVEWMYLCKYDRTTQTVEVLYEHMTLDLNLVGDNLYFVSEYAAGGESETSGHAKIITMNIHTNEASALEFGDEIADDYAHTKYLSVYNQKLYFLSTFTFDGYHGSFLCSYDTQTGEMTPLINTEEILEYMPKEEGVESLHIQSYSVAGENDYYFHLANFGYMLVRIKDEKMEVMQPYNPSDRWHERFLYKVENRFVSYLWADNPEIDRIEINYEELNLALPQKSFD